VEMTPLLFGIYNAVKHGRHSMFLFRPSMHRPESAAARTTIRTNGAAGQACVSFSRANATR